MEIFPPLENARSNPTIIMLANLVILKINVLVLSLAGKITSSNANNLDQILLLMIHNMQGYWECKENFYAKKSTCLHSTIGLNTLKNWSKYDCSLELSNCHLSSWSNFWHNLQLISLDKPPLASTFKICFLLVTNGQSPVWRNEWSD